jgi:hypothetical protein
VLFEHAIAQHHIGEAITLEVMRAKKVMTTRLPLLPYASLVPPPRPDRRPSYVVFAGLVFTSLGYEYIHDWDWARDHHRYRMLELETFPTHRRKEVVIIREVLAHAVNLGYHQMKEVIVERINGQEIGELADVPRALAAPTGKFQVIETDYHGPRSESHRSDYHSSYGTRIVLDAEHAARATPEILQQHGIPADRSPDL